MQPTSPTDICNLALGHLGEARITSLEEDSTAARACYLHYDSTRRHVLRSHRWNFAQKRKVLTRLSENPVFGWRYQFELPADFVRVLELNGSEAGDALTEPYIVEGRQLLTNATDARLVYVANISTVSLFDSIFCEALAYQLAVKLSETIRGTTGKTESLLQAYERVVAPLARRVDANEGKRRKGLLPLNSLALRARGVGAGALFPDFDQWGGYVPDGTESETEDDEDSDDMPDTWTTTLTLHGEAVDGQTFGSYQPVEVVDLVALEITAQVAPLGGIGLRVQLVDAFDTNIGDAVLLPVAEEQVRSVLATPLEIAADTVIRAKFTSVGSSQAGDGINVILSFRTHED